MKSIKGLHDREGVIKTEEDDKLNIVAYYFKNIFSSSRSVVRSEVLEGVGSCVNQRMNECLIPEFKGEEIDVAVREMGSMKAPGCDGFPGIFF